MKDGGGGGRRGWEEGEGGRKERVGGRRRWEEGEGGRKEVEKT